MLPFGLVRLPRPMLLPARTRPAQAAVERPTTRSRNSTIAVKKHCDLHSAPHPFLNSTSRFSYVVSIGKQVQRLIARPQVLPQTRVDWYVRDSFPAAPGSWDAT